ncbi:unnamed protein product [Ilex paraguariensis]|uniref:Uncharacterized protein n=1 Tax=Ilex paraguariensis TaxID=185542 RepID=A0ABC8RWG5_9AQUA
MQVRVLQFEWWDVVEIGGGNWHGVGGRRKVGKVRVGKRVTTERVWESPTMWAIASFSKVNVYLYEEGNLSIAFPFIPLSKSPGIVELSQYHQIHSFSAISTRLKPLKKLHSEHSKHIKKEEVEEDEENPGPVFENRKKKLDHASPSSGSHREGKVKKEERKVKKEEVDYIFEATTKKGSSKINKEVAKEVLKRKKKKIQQHKLDSPMKVVVTVKKNAKTIPIKRKTSSSSSSVLTKKTTLPPESKSTIMSK